jgi:hypothetical protein
MAIAEGTIGSSSKTEEVPVEATLTAKAKDSEIIVEIAFNREEEEEEAEEEYEEVDGHHQGEEEEEEVAVDVAHVDDFFWNDNLLYV